MNTVSSFGFKRPIWQSIVMLTLGFWLSASLLLDWVIMPSLYVSGMITQASFATAGYVIFWNFNRIELLAAGLVLTGVLALNQTQSKWLSGSLILSVLLLAISFTTTYFLTPEMSAIGMQLNLFQTTAEVPANMNLLHGSYWLLEVIKLVAGGTLLSWCWRQ
ncbi:MAG: hypothetical protein NHB32_05910 [Fischerella sp. CENA71]|nr:hypothetical protein [Fischerella sp. CENA71]